jgi:ubiquitin C-terminal hydrolase
MCVMREDFLNGRGTNGIDNLGSTCYINAMLQSLGHCMPFLRFILHGQYRAHLKEAEETTIIMHLRDVYKDLWILDRKVTPREFLRRVAQKMSFLDILEQNDINEFMTLFIDKLGGEIARKLDYDRDIGPDRDREPRDHYEHQAIAMEKDWREKTAKEYSELFELLHGHSINQITCGHCSKIHHNYEMFLNLSLPITRGCDTLEKCLEEYFKNEIINDTNDSSKSDPWKCDNCNVASKSNKLHTIWKTPQVLVLSLKRFTSNMQKITQQVHVPDTLDLSDYVLCRNAYKKYTLKAVALHYGSFYGGHYVAVCKNPNGNWYLFDDETVRPLGPNVDLSHSYVCFYEAGELSSS